MISALRRRRAHKRGRFPRSAKLLINLFGLILAPCVKAIPQSRKSVALNRAYTSRQAFSIFRPPPMWVTSNAGPNPDESRHVDSLGSRRYFIFYPGPAWSSPQTQFLRRVPDHSLASPSRHRDLGLVACLCNSATSHASR